MKNLNRPVWQLKKELAEGTLTSRELVEAYLERIEEVNPKLNAYLYVAREEALAAADACDEARRNGQSLGPLHGIPVALKDNMSVEGMQNTCASRFLEGYVAPYDATIVEKLKAAGAIILGKLNMDEFAMGSANEFSAYGPVKNPWDLTRVPGGSSGGSAAAVAAGLAPVSLGTDTGGSVRQPAAFTNLVGLKPTYGRISRYGITAFGSTLDQVGIFSQDVRDCSLMLQVLAGLDPKDSTSSDQPLPKELSGDAPSLEGVRLALPKSFLEGLEEPIKRQLDAVVETFESLGASVDLVDLEMVPRSLAVYYIVASAEASSNLARFDGIRYGQRKMGDGTMKDLYVQSRTQGFGEEVRRRIMLGTYVLSAGYYDAYYNTALKVRTLIREEFQRLFASYDAIIGPTTPTLPRRLGERPDNCVLEYLNDLYTVPANIAGIPAIAFPMGFVEGLPVSCQLMGNYFSERRLFELVQAFEEKTDYTEKKAEELL